MIDKDPERDRLRTMYQKERIKETDLAVLAELSASTVKNMFGGKTRRPQHATFAKMASAMRYYEYALSREKAPNYEKEIPVAREQFRAHKEYLRKKREREEKRASK